MRAGMRSRSRNIFLRPGIPYFLEAGARAVISQHPPALSSNSSRLGTLTAQPISQQCLSSCYTYPPWLACPQRSMQRVYKRRIGARISDIRSCAGVTCSSFVYIVTPAKEKSPTSLSKLTSCPRLRITVVQAS